MMMMREAIPKIEKVIIFTSHEKSLRKGM